MRLPTRREDVRYFAVAPLYLLLLVSLYWSQCVPRDAPKAPTAIERAH